MTSPRRTGEVQGLGAMPWVTLPHIKAFFEDPVESQITSRVDGEAERGRAQVVFIPCAGSKALLHNKGRFGSRFTALHSFGSERPREERGDNMGTECRASPQHLQSAPWWDEECRC